MERRKKYDLCNMELSLVPTSFDLKFFLIPPMIELLHLKGVGPLCIYVKKCHQCTFFE